MLRDVAKKGEFIGAGTGQWWGWVWGWHGFCADGLSFASGSVTFSWPGLTAADRRSQAGSRPSGGTGARRPGLAPAGEILFFACPKKRIQKKRQPDALSLRFATGTLRCSRRAGEAQNSLRSDMRLSFPARHCATRQGIRQVVSTGLCFARPGFGSPRCARDHEVGKSRTSPDSHRERSEAIHPPRRRPG